MNGSDYVSKKKWSFTFSSLHVLNPFWLQLFYFTILSSLGFLALKFTNPRTPTKPHNTDLFFTSVSASTVSSMSVVEMEVFSNVQLLLLTVLMFVGGEVFTSMLGLALRLKRESNQNPPPDLNHTRNTKSTAKALTYMVSCYLLVVHALGSLLVSLYFTTVPLAKRVLEKKGIKVSTFSIFATVSTFSNCGFLPTNENMVVFKSNPGLIWILIPQVLMGNTMYPVFLWLSICVVGKVTRKAVFGRILESSGELGYGRHLIPGLETVYLGLTVLGLMLVQMVCLCFLEWSNEGVGGGLSVYQKVVGFLFVAVNSRHAGESGFDLSAFSSAILVMIVFMMYLHPYTSYLPIRINEKTNTSKNKKKQFRLWEYMLLSDLTYLCIFVFLICITERHAMKTDPLNFNILNIVVEVVSAYGNVGFSVGYSCQRQINPDGKCIDKWYGFAGKWSGMGKALLIIVMFFGRLKNFNKRGGRAWNLG